MKPPLSWIHGLGAIAALLSVHPANASIIFDNFNTDEGHFASAPNFSGTTVGEDAATSADHILIEGPFEGAGHQKLTLIHDATSTAFRLRHLSGGGTVANNIAFPITAGEDGFIGFYLKTTATGWQTSINLDGAGGAITEMDGSSSLEIIADGEWHLYEWDLDSTSLWGAVPGITSNTHGGSLPFGTHTIDSIYFRDLDGSPGPTADIYLDFVAKSDSGSVAALVIPEPSTLGLATAGLLALATRRRGRLS
ncbi:MAG: PEP-CTERM sorting domain-containing protein [Verrucomicrobiota bacterium]